MSGLKYPQGALLYNHQYQPQGDQPLRNDIMVGRFSLAV